MRPSPPDPRKSPPEFQQEQSTHVQGSLAEPEFDIEDSSSDYYGDEYNSEDGEEEDYLYTSTEIPKLVPKKVKSERNETLEAAGESLEKDDIEGVGGGKGNSTGTQDSSESIQKEVKVGIGGNKGGIKVTKKKVKKVKQEEVKVQRDVNGEINSSDSSSSPQSFSIVDPSKPDSGLIPYVMEPPEILSTAWECPGRKVGMPRGHWPWMVILD